MTARSPLPVPLLLAGGTACAITAVVWRLGPAGLILLGVAAAGSLLIRRPGVALALCATVFVLVEQRADAFLSVPVLYEPIAAGVSPATALLCIFIVAVVLGAAGRARPVSLHATVGVGAGVLIGAIAAGSITAASAGVSGGEIADNVVKLSSLAVLPWAVHAALHGPSQVRTAFWVLGSLITAKAVLNLLSVATGIAAPDPALATDGVGPRVTSYDPTVNWLCLAMLLVGVAAVVRRVGPSRVVLFAMPLLVASLVLSYRRSFWIATALGLIIVVALGTSGLQRRLALPAFVLAALVLWAAVTVGGGSDLLHGRIIERAVSVAPASIAASREDRYRLAERANVLDELRRSPVAGLGIGVPWRARHPLPIENPRGREYVHFAVLWLWIKLGVLGALAYVLLLGGAVLAAWQASRRHPDPTIAVVALGLVGAVAALALAESTATFTGADGRFTAVLGGVLGLISRIRATAG